MVLELKSKALHQLCHGNALCSCGLTLVLGRSCFILRRVIYFEDCLLLALSLTVSKKVVIKKKKKSSRLLFAMMYSLWICAKPRAEHLLKKITEEREWCSHSLSSMFVSSVYQDQSSGTSVQHLETSRGQGIYCMQICHPFWWWGEKRDKALKRKQQWSICAPSQKCMNLISFSLEDVCSENHNILQQNSNLVQKGLGTI